MGPIEKGSVQVTDHVLWLKHITDAPKLTAWLLEIRAGDEVMLRVDGNVGIWCKMQNGIDGRPTNGLKPVGLRAKTAWYALVRTRLHEIVPLYAPEGHVVLKRARGSQSVEGDYDGPAPKLGGDFIDIPPVNTRQDFDPSSAENPPYPLPAGWHQMTTAQRRLSRQFIEGTYVPEPAPTKRQTFRSGPKPPKPVPAGWDEMTPSQQQLSRQFIEDAARSGVANPPRPVPGGWYEMTPSQRQLSRQFIEDAARSKRKPTTE